MDERELIAAAQKGSERAFEALVRQYENKVYSLCRRMLRSDADAEEAAQDAFLAVWRGLGEFRGESAFSTWLYRLASNACIDLLRREKRGAPALSLDDEESAFEVRDERPSPEEAVERAETAELVREAIERLSDDYRMVLVLRELRGLSYAEIAEETGVELGTVKSRIARARAMLRDDLTARGNFFEKLPSKKIKNADEEKGVGAK